MNILGFIAANIYYFFDYTPYFFTQKRNIFNFFISNYPIFL